MLLSFPTWLIHISSMAEWLYAAVLLYRYGALLGRNDVQRFALCMLPHWFGGMCVIIYHLLGDAILLWLDLSKLLNCAGSIALLYAALRLLYPNKFFNNDARTTAMLVVFFHAPIAAQLSDKSLSSSEAIVFNPMFVNAVFQLSSMIYLGFLIALWIFYRRDKRTASESIFSGVTVAGFWFLLIFVTVTVGCIYIATKLRGYPTLTHDDALHGFAEFFLTISNTMIVFGVRQKLRDAMQKQ
jgi:hypothetical protein